MKHLEQEKIQKKLEKSLGQTVEDFHYLPQGLSNHNFYAKTADKEYVLRYPKKANESLFDYHLEAQILEKVEGVKINVPTLFFDPEKGVKISPYIPNAKHFSLEYLDRACDLIINLHQAKIKTGVHYDIVEEFEKYQDFPGEPLFDTSYALDNLYYVQSLDDEKILCHNDLVEGNFLFSDEGDYLIDYEYAKDNHPYFDIMSFITENDIQDKEAREHIFQRYFGRSPNKDERHKLLAFERALHVLWAEWASYMYYHHGDEIYYEIARLKAKRLKETYA